jgi:DNA-directed RNA polymerase subunit RPC12/RpoP
MESLKSENKFKQDTQLSKFYENCPHCGKKLSPWQQTLLYVDRTLMCKNCWYRIELNGFLPVDKI